MTRSSLFVLDTNTVTYILSGRSQAARQSLKVEREHSKVGISAITQGEILFGLENKPAATRLRASVEEFFGTVHVLPWDSSVAQVYGGLRVRISAARKALTAMDMLIAAHAVSLNAVLVTHDKAFLQISSLVNVVDWASDL